MARTLEATNPEGKANELDAGQVEEFFGRLDELHDKAEANAGTYRSDIKEVYAEAADQLGLTRKVLKHEYKIRRAKRKTAKRESEFEDSEKLSLEQLRNALGPLDDTPLGDAAKKKH